MTELTLRLEIILALDISFIANNFCDFLFSTFQTFPNPPRPMAYLKLKLFLVIARSLLGWTTWNIIIFVLYSEIAIPHYELIICNPHLIQIGKRDVKRHFD